jgi:hypothetical protein
LPRLFLHPGGSPEGRAAGGIGDFERRLKAPRSVPGAIETTTPFHCERRL